MDPLQHSYLATRLYGYTATPRYVWLGAAYNRNVFAIPCHGSHAVNGIAIETLTNAANWGSRIRLHNLLSGTPFFSCYTICSPVLMLCTVVNSATWTPACNLAIKKKYDLLITDSAFPGCHLGRMDTSSPRSSVRCSSFVLL